MFVNFRQPLPICSPGGKLHPQPPAPGVQPSCCPPWTKQMWNVSLFYSLLLAYYFVYSVNNKKVLITKRCIFWSSYFFICLHFTRSARFLFSHVSSLEVTLALLDAATDKDSKVQEQVRKSILTLGKQQPDRVLAMCQDYLLKHPKVKQVSILCCQLSL